MKEIDNRLPEYIKVKGARVHNLKNINVDVPLNKIVGIAGVSGSGKSSLALGVLYAEGSRRYLESLSTYTRRRMTQATRAQVDEVRYVPASLALHQRPSVPGIRSTFGTSTELLNSIRLMFSRLSNYKCKNGHEQKPSLNIARELPLICPICGEEVETLGAEDLAFNSAGACKTCGGTGLVQTVDRQSLIPDENLTIENGAVAPWNSLMWSLMTDVCKAMGVRIDVPFKDLTPQEKEIVYDGPKVKKHIFYKPKYAENQTAGEMDFTYYSATATVLNALQKVKDEKGYKRVEKFLKEDVCPDCNGTRLSAKVRTLKLRGLSLDQVCQKTLSDLIEWVGGVPDSLPEEMRSMASSICESFFDTAKRLVDLGLSYLTLDRRSSTLSTGERQRVQLARAVRNLTTGVLYVLDEPSIGLHPNNVKGLIGVMNDLVKDGNSVVLVDHDTTVLKASDHIIELGPKAGANGGEVIAKGSVDELAENPKSIIGKYLKQDGSDVLRDKTPKDRLFDLGQIKMQTNQIHTVKPLNVAFPKGRLSVVTGVSGSGKTTMVLESLVPALLSKIKNKSLPLHVISIEADGIDSVKLIDATPIGVNVRSTVATYADIHDELRKVFARTDDAKRLGLKAGDFSYNTGKLRCPTCDGTGSISLDVQFLPDVDIPCPDCKGSRYSKEASKVKRIRKDGVSFTLPFLMSKSVDEAIVYCDDLPLIKTRLQTLSNVGLGYLTLGEQTPGLSGGEAQRLKLAGELGRSQSTSLFVFDEPTIGLHPLDVKTLVGVFEGLIRNGATVIIIEHDLDVIRNADYLVDLGPEGGELGGEIVAQGDQEDIKANKRSLTGKYI